VRGAHLQRAQNELRSVDAKETLPKVPQGALRGSFEGCSVGLLRAISWPVCSKASRPYPFNKLAHRRRALGWTPEHDGAGPVTRGQAVLGPYPLATNQALLRLPISCRRWRGIPPDHPCRRRQSYYSGDCQLTETSTIQRAIELAQNGPCRNVEEIRVQLRRERFSNITEHLAGLSIRKQLVALIQQRNDGEQSSK